MSNFKNPIEECNKDQLKCINFVKCKGKWHRYRNKNDNGYCKACIKNENDQVKGIKKNSHYNRIFDC